MKSRFNKSLFNLSCCIVLVMLFFVSVKPVVFSAEVAEIDSGTGEITGLKAGKVEVTVDYIFKGQRHTSEPFTVTVGGEEEMVVTPPDAKVCVKAGEDKENEKKFTASICSSDGSLKEIVSNWTIIPSDLGEIKDPGGTAQKSITFIGKKPGKGVIKAEDINGDVWPGEANIMVVDVELDFEGAIEEEEDGTQIGFICVNGDDDNKNMESDVAEDGTVDDEDDLKKVTLKVMPEDLKEGEVVLDIGIGGSSTRRGDKIKVWEDKTKGTRVHLPQTFKPSELPKEFYVEGLNPSSENEAELKSTYNKGDTKCEDKVRITVIQVEFAESEETSGDFQPGIDLLPVFNPNPIVELDTLASPGTGDNPQVTVAGVVTSFIAPILQDHIFVNGVAVASVSVVSDGTDNLGSFVRRFTSAPIAIGNDAFSIVATAVNAVNNFGSDSLIIKVERSDVGAISSRMVTANDSVPELPTNLETFLDISRFKIEVDDDSKTENMLEVSFNTGVETRNVKLEKSAEGNTFLSKNLFFVSEDITFPTGTSDIIKDTRLKSKFGVIPEVTYNISNGECKDIGIPTGIRVVRNNLPQAFIQSGVAEDVTMTSQNITFTIEAGGPGFQLGEEIPGVVTSLNKSLSALVQPTPSTHFPPIQLSGDPVKLTRVNNEISSPEHNLYRSDSAKPLMAVRTQLPLNAAGSAQDNASLSELYVKYRGFVKVVSSSINGAENIEPVSGLQMLSAKANSATESLNPPFVETDFVPVFNHSPIVLITTFPLNISLATRDRNQMLQGEVISFVNELQRAQVMVNGVQVTTLTQDPNNPSTGPWRATFEAAVTIDMDEFTAVVSAFDGQRNIGQDSVDYKLIRDATNNVFAITVMNGNTLPASNLVNNLIDDNSVTLKEAIVFLQNRQCRVDGNPILRGNLPFMINVNQVTMNRQTDAAGTLTGTAKNFNLSGGAFSTDNFLLLAPPRPATGFVANAKQYVANLGEFVRANTSVVALRVETASSKGVLIYDNANNPTDIVVPGSQADIGANPADLRLFARVGVSGFDSATGSGRTTITAELQSVDKAGGDIAAPPAPIVLPSGRFINFAPTNQDITLTRVNDDPKDPRFNLFRLLKIGTMDEEPITPVNTGTFPDNTSKNPATVLTADQGLQYVQSTGLLTLSSDSLPNESVSEPVIGPRISRIVTTITNNAGVDIGTSNDRDFAIQLNERPVCKVESSVAPGRVSPILLRVERKFVAANNDRIPANSDGFEVVAFLDVDTAAGHQHQRNMSGSVSLRLPPSAATANTLIRVGANTMFNANIARSVNPDKFEGLNLANVTFNRNRTAAAGGGAVRALPPDRYWVRPVVQSPNNPVRLILGNEMTITTPNILHLIYNGSFTADLQNTWRLIAPALPALQATQLTNAFISQITRLSRNDFNINTMADGRGTLTANSVNLRLVRPGNLQPQFNDFVVPVNIGGGVAGLLGGAGTLDVLNDDTDEDAFSGARNGIFTGRVVLNNLGAQGRSIYGTFTVGGAATAFGAVMGDTVNSVVNPLNAGIATAPRALNNRNDMALNGAVGFCRNIASTISHEVGHTLGLVASRSDINNPNYITNSGGIPVARAANVLVGAPGAHNGLVGGGAAGNLPTFTAAAAGVATVDDLNLPTVRNNLMMDTGALTGASELLEGGSSGVIANPPLSAQPAATFFNRNLQQIQAVLPIDKN